MQRRYEICGFAALVFAGLIAAEGAEAKHFTVLYAFGAQENFADGAHPNGLVADKAGNLYGATCCGGANGFGAIFKLAADGTQTVLYSFRNAEDGEFPESGLARDKAGNLYGVTGIGGTIGGGTAFKLSPSGQFGVLHAFGGTGDGSVPNGSLVLGRSKTLYGTTYAGGASDKGTLFRVAADGTETVLYSFSKQGGYYPVGALAADGAGNLFGTTYNGGSTHCDKGCGTVFELAADGGERTLYTFQGGADGAGPESNLVIDAAGNIYGGTDYGGGTGCGGPGCGMVFKLTPDGTESVLHAFANSGEGAQPLNFVFDKTGQLFGTTFTGGGGCAKGGCGIAFKLLPDGTLDVLHVFTGASDGAEPNGILAGKKGRLLGTAQLGGNNGGGVIFAIKP